MKVLHVTPCYAPAWEQGGPAWSVPNLCRSIAHLGHDVTVFTTNVNGAGRLKVPVGCDVWRDQVRVRYFPITFGWPPRYNVSLRLAAALLSEVTCHDLVHIQGAMTFPSAVAGLLCRRRGIPYLVSPRGVLDREGFKKKALRKRLYTRLVERRNLAGAAAVHFATEEERRRCTHLPLMVPTIVVPNSLDFAEFDAPPTSGAFTTQYPETTGKRLILFLGRLSYNKGLDFLVRAFSLLARRRTDVHLVVVGPDPGGYAHRLRSWLAREGIADRATFTGLLVGGEKLAVLRESDVLVLPSYHSESFGLAAAEAMAARLPVVLSSKANLAPDVVAAGAGFAIDYDPHAWADALEILLDRPDLAHSMGERGRSLVRERFDTAVVARRMCSAYGEILSRGGFATEPAPEVSG